jgi:SHS2 domain-containing protein
MMRYQLIDHTADVMVRCTGKDLSECFENAAYAMYDQMVDASAINGERSFEIEVQGDDDESKLYNFLSELLFVTDCEGLVFNSFKVSFNGDSVRCTACGEPLDTKRHKARGEIKAVTYHMLSVDRDVPAVTVIFDL